MEITENQFREYEKIRKSGKYQMYDDAEVIWKILGMNKESYFELIFNYLKLAKKYGNKN